MRGREFSMKDAYSFDKDQAGALKAYTHRQARGAQLYIVYLACHSIELILYTSDVQNGPKTDSCKPGWGGEFSENRKTSLQMIADKPAFSL